MWHHQPFSQRNKATKRARGIECVCMCFGQNLKKWEGGVGTMGASSQNREIRNPEPAMLHY